MLSPRPGMRIRVTPDPSPNRSGNSQQAAIPESRL